MSLLENNKYMFGINKVIYLSFEERYLYDLNLQSLPHFVSGVGLKNCIKTAPLNSM